MTATAIRQRPACRNCNAIGLWARMAGAYRLVNLVDAPVPAVRTYWLESEYLRPRAKGGPPPFAHQLPDELVDAALDAGLILAVDHRDICPNDQPFGPL